MISAVRKARPCRIGPHRCGGALVALFALVVLPWWLCPGGFALVVIRVVPWFGVPWWFGELVVMP